MHRSGTSLVANLLRECGVNLGPADEFFPPDPHNADGYWENRRFVELNDALLDALGGGWDMPPPVEANWESSPAAEPFYESAALLLGQLGLEEPWAWKDLRNSLTLPFWRGVLGDLKVLICLRNPLEVVLSLQRREASPPTLGLSLWLEYNRRLLAASDPSGRVITQYDAYFSEPAAELRRVLSTLELSLAEESIEASVSRIPSRALRHHEAAPDRWSLGLPPAVVDLYEEMAAEAGGRTAQAGASVVRHGRP